MPFNLKIDMQHNSQIQDTEFTTCGCRCKSCPPLERHLNRQVLDNLIFTNHIVNWCKSREGSYMLDNHAKN